MKTINLKLLVGTMLTLLLMLFAPITTWAQNTFMVSGYGDGSENGHIFTFAGWTDQAESEPYILGVNVTVNHKSTCSHIFQANWTRNSLTIDGRTTTTSGENTNITAIDQYNNLVADVTITRSFTTDKWATLVLPFAMTADEVKTIVGLTDM